MPGAARAVKRGAQADDAAADHRHVSRHLADAPAEWIALVEEQRALRGHVGSSPDGGNDLARRAIKPSVRRAEGAADDAFLHPGCALGKLAVRGEAGELGAGAGAARRAVVGLAGTQDEAARARAGCLRRPEELHMVDIRMPLRVQRLADAPGAIGQSLDASEILLYEKKPVAAPGDIAFHNLAVDINVDCLVRTPTRHVLHRDFAVRFQRRRDRSHRRLDEMLARLDAPHVRERDHQADGAVAAHADGANVVEENDAGARRRIDRLDQQRADDDVGAARLVHRRGAVAVELALQALAPGGQRPAAEVGTTLDDDASRLAARVRVDNLQLLHLLRLDAELLGELAELLDLGANHLSEFLRCIADRLQPRLDEAP